jgi:hypothetical protein
VGKHRFIDPVVAKRGLIFVKAETAKPSAHIHGRAPHGSAGYLRSRDGLSSIAIEEDIK